MRPGIGAELVGLESALEAQRVESNRAAGGAEQLRRQQRNRILALQVAEEHRHRLARVDVGSEERTSVCSCSIGPSSVRMMSVPPMRVCSSMSNSGSMRFGLVKEMLPRVTWNVRPGEVHFAAFAQRHPAAERRLVGGAHDTDRRGGFQPRVVVVDAEIFLRRHEDVQVQLLEAAFLLPAGAARRVRRAAASAAMLIGSLKTLRATMTSPVRLHPVASGLMIRSASDSLCRPRGYSSAAPCTCSVRRAADRAGAAQQKAAVDHERTAVRRAGEAVEQHTPAVEGNRAFQIAEHDARLANQHFGVGDVDASAEHRRRRRAADARR